MAEVSSRVAAIVVCFWFVALGGWNTRTMAATIAAADPPLPSCTSALIPLQACLKFVTGLAQSPTSDCCSGVLQIHRTQPVCLCVLAMNDTTTNLIPGYSLDDAVQLPTLCSIQGASMSNCPALLGQTNGTTTPSAASPVASAPSVIDNGGTYSLRTSSSLRSLAFAYFAIVLAASAVIGKM